MEEREELESEERRLRAIFQDDMRMVRSETIGSVYDKVYNFGF